jgi:acetylornithine deacetylase/succinyl-diaminopimelate desuccinylase-like protein
VAGFYDDVVTLTEAERASIAAVPFDEAKFRAGIGIGEVYGEAGYSTNERLWARPTLELVGMWGGFQGEGVKTVLPREAHAKITCRLVPDQNPNRILDVIEKHVEAHAPRGVTVRFSRRSSMGYPYLMPSDHPASEAAREVLRELYGHEPYETRSGGSVPITAIFLQHLGAYSVSFGFGLPDEQFHAPNEFVRLRSFERGQVAYGRLLERLGEG